MKTGQDRERERKKKKDVGCEWIRGINESHFYETSPRRYLRNDYV